MFLYVSSIGRRRRRGWVPAVGGVLIVALVTGVVLTSSGTGGESGFASPYVLADGEFDGGSWQLVANVDDGDLGLVLRASDGSERGVGDYTTPYTLREAEAWVVPSSASDDGFLTIVAGPVPDGVVPAVQAAEGGRSAEVEIVEVADVLVFLATLEGAVRHFDLIARDADGNEVGRETRQATYTRMGVRPPEGDTWVLDLLRTRHWERAEIIVRNRDGEPEFRVVAWGETNNVQVDLPEGVVWSAFIDRIEILPGRYRGGYGVVDSRFAPCIDPWAPSGTSEGSGTSSFRPIPDLKLGPMARWLAPWTEVEPINLAKVELEGDDVIRGRRTHRVSLTQVRSEEAAGLPSVSRTYRWLVDAESGIVVGTGVDDMEPTPLVEVVALDDDVDPPSLEDVRFPEGTVYYGVTEPHRDDGGVARNAVAVYDRSATTSDGTLTLQDLIDEFGPAEALIDCELRREPMRP